jgi:hypothetical protein
MQPLWEHMVPKARLAFAFVWIIGRGPTSIGRPATIFQEWYMLSFKPLCTRGKSTQDIWEIPPMQSHKNEFEAPIKQTTIYKNRQFHVHNIWKTWSPPRCSLATNPILRRRQDSTWLPTKGKIAGGEGDLAMQGASERIIIDFVSSYANQSSWVVKAACKLTKIGRDTSAMANTLHLGLTFKRFRTTSPSRMSWSEDRRQIDLRVVDGRGGSCVAEETFSGLGWCLLLGKVF